MSAKGVQPVVLTRLTSQSGTAASVEDHVAVEEPLEIRVGVLRGEREVVRPLSITMRTPGKDFELAVGFLFSEQVIAKPEDVAYVRHCGDGEQTTENVVRVQLGKGVSYDHSRVARSFYTTSSCGVCGKSSIDALELLGITSVESDAFISAAELSTLPALLRDRQPTFDRTGGVHAAGLWVDSSFVDVQEDVGRHNAVDKIVGSRVLAGPEALRQMTNAVLVLSGRAGFELVQKAVVAGIPIVASVGAPSSLAVSVARRYGLTLAGFVGPTSLNVYTSPERVIGEL